MRLPVDMSQLMDEVTNIDEARETPLSVSLLLDETAPLDCIAHVRATFSSSAPSLRLTVGYLNGRPFTPYPADDMAVIVAGTWEGVGETAANLRDAGVPVMVVSTMPSLVGEMAQAFGHPIPEGDLVSPASAGSLVGDITAKISKVAGNVADGALGAAAGVTRALAPESKVAGFVGSAAKHRAENAKPEIVLTPDQEPFVLDADLKSALDQRMGQWIVAACHDKRLALSLAFPFTGRSLAHDAVATTALENAGIAILPIVPDGADLPIMTLNQAKMVLRIAAAYGYPMSADRAAEIVTVVVTALISRSVARAVCKVVPPAKLVACTAIGYTSTMILGNAMIEYYEGGDAATGMGGVINTALGAGENVVSGVSKIALSKMSEAGIDQTEMLGKVSAVASKAASVAFKAAAH